MFQSVLKYVRIYLLRTQQLNLIIKYFFIMIDLTIVIMHYSLSIIMSLERL